MNFRLLILLCILCPLGLWSQTGTVSGFVQDPDKNPVLSVLIYEKSNQNNRVLSDSEGGFKINIPANRDIILILNFPGIPSSEKMVRVDANENKIIVVTFDPTQEKAPVVITERRRPVSIIRINPKLATELQDFLLVDKWKTPSGETLTDFDRAILDMKRPENHEMKVKVGLLLKLLEKDPTLSTIQRTGVTKKSNQLFGEVARQVTKAKSSGGTGSKANPNSWFL